jgi:hypothetical protein
MLRKPSVQLIVPFSAVPARLFIFPVLLAELPARHVWLRVGVITKLPVASSSQLNQGCSIPLITSLPNAQT